MQRLKLAMTRLETYRQWDRAYKKIGNESAARQFLGKQDLFFLLTRSLGRRDIDRDWLFQRCREVQLAPNGYLDLWAREHYKSTIITYGMTILELLNNPELTFGILSFNRPTAKAFLFQIKSEFEGNEQLKADHHDVLWQRPRSEAPRWSLDDGIVLKRKHNPKEATIEAWGMVDGMPTGRHWQRVIYDDIITEKSITTPDMIKKVNQAWELSVNLGADGGARRIIGTRYHFNDTYQLIMTRGSAKVRLHPATHNGMDLHEGGKPVLLSEPSLIERRRDMGPYTFGCHYTGTMVLMADWTEKPIERLEIGDLVVGFTLANGKRARLVPTRVLAKKSRRAPIVRYWMESGRSVIATPDHLWWTGRRDGDHHRIYAPLGLDGNATKALCSVYDPRILAQSFDADAAAYLAGIFDGEGSVSSGTLHITQSEGINGAVVARIRECLKRLGYDWNEFRAPDRDQLDFCLRGGRPEIMRFLNQCRPAKAPQIIKSMFERGTRNFGMKTREALVRAEDLGHGEVWNIQTETGNYVAAGYASKNCQMLQNPKADKAQGFDAEWLRYYTRHNEGAGMNIYITVDPASEKKDESDYTAMMVVGLGGDKNFYVLDMIRDRLRLTERADALFELHRRWRPKLVGYEKYGLQADIEHIKDRQNRENYRFDIVLLGGQMPKPDRIKRLIPIAEQNRLWLPESLHKVDYEQKIHDLVSIFIEQEYKAFPVGMHEDMLDALARILDPEMNLIWPKPPPESQRSDRYSSKSPPRQRGSHMSA